MGAALGDLLDADEDALGERLCVGPGRALEQFGEADQELFFSFSEAKSGEGVGVVCEQGLGECEPFVGAEKLGSVDRPGLRYDGI
jgi:hypothetical protein